jgi:hypothetical protein
MAEEKKGVSAKAILKMLTGVVLVLFGVGLIWTWRGYVIILLRGCIGFIIVLCGAIFLAIAKE